MSSNGENNGFLGQKRIKKERKNCCFEPYKIANFDQEKST